MPDEEADVPKFDTSSGSGKMGGQPSTAGMMPPNSSDEEDDAEDMFGSGGGGQSSNAGMLPPNSSDEEEDEYLGGGKSKGKAPAAKAAAAFVPVEKMSKSEMKGLSEEMQVREREERRLGLVFKDSEMCVFTFGWRRHCGAFHEPALFRRASFDFPHTAAYLALFPFSLTHALPVLPPLSVCNLLGNAGPTRLQPGLRRTGMTDFCPLALLVGPL
jgi:hypothetical protein